MMTINSKYVSIMSKEDKKYFSKFTISVEGSKYWPRHNSLAQVEWGFAGSHIAYTVYFNGINWTWKINMITLKQTDVRY